LALAIMEISVRTVPCLTLETNYDIIL